jgi:acetyl-CoA carboxylase biotin carboxyl carrier protein
MSAEKTNSSPTNKSAGNASGSPQDIFDVRKIRRLVELMKEHDLTQIDLRQGTTRVQIQRGNAVEVTQAVATPVMMPAASVAAGAPAKPAAPATAAPPAEDEKTALIRSPMVGTFYSAPDPDSPAYVKVGDHVGPETTVCIVEAMKVFNEIPAEVSGKVVAVLVENGEPVEFGQPMFKVDPRG